jgi:hypothetical protein
MRTGAESRQHGAVGRTQLDDHHAFGLGDQVGYLERQGFIRHGKSPIEQPLTH